MAGTDDLKNMLMSFRVSELQMLLGFAGRCKNGRKNDLQTRAVDLLKLKSTPIQMKIRELYKSIQGESSMQQVRSDGAGTGYMPQQQPLQWDQNRASVYSGYYSQAGSYIPPPTFATMFPVHPDVKLKPLPFYDHLSELLKPSTLMPVGTAKIQEQSFVFHLTPAQAHELAFNRNIGSAGSEYIVQAQMRFCLLETSCEQEDCFPPGIIVKVNDKACALPAPIPTNQQGKEPKRPPRPVNISSLVRISPTVANTILVSWSVEFGRGYVIAISLVRKQTSAQLVQRLQVRGVRHADYTTGLIKEKLSDTDSEIATTSLRVSLMCPLGKMRMSLPCRPTTCSHLQCFDANVYLRMNEKKPSWLCPVCNQPGPYDKLVIDGYFQEVLCSSRLPSDANEIELQSDGSWSISSQTKEWKDTDDPLTLVKNRGGPPVVEATVEIIDDDVVPVDYSDGDGKEKKEGSKDQIQPPPKPGNISTVDLTLSDDEDVDVVSVPMKTDIHLDDVNCSGVRKPLVTDMTPVEFISLDSPSPPTLDSSDPLLPDNETVIHVPNQAL